MTADSPKIALRQIDELTPDPRNARTHSAEQVAQIAQSIARFGWTNPILADDLIRAGHGRTMAARAIYEDGGTIYLAPGRERGGKAIPKGTVPVIDCTGWTEDERKAYALADNQLAEKAGWDMEILSAQLDELTSAEFDIAEIGFDMAAIDALGMGEIEAIEPEWHTGDSNKVLADPAIGDGFDFVFSCPPYGDLEVYSDDPDDISTLEMSAFDAIYADIIAKAVERLADNRFACFVVGDYRDKRGIYANFVSKTIAAFEAAGAPLYNEAILITSVGSLPIRTAKQFRSTRKLGKTHQNILVFVKGDPRKAVEALGPVDVSDALARFEEEDGEGD